MNPCFTDFMDKFLEDQECGGGGTRDRSASPNVNCLLSTDMKRTRLDSTSSNHAEQPTTAPTSATTKSAKTSKDNLLAESSSDKNQIECKGTEVEVEDTEEI